MIKPLFLAAAALAACTGPVAAQSLEKPGSQFVAPDNPGNWQTTIARTKRGHMIGNPQAKAQLIEFISYTCPHCAHFTAQGEPALELSLLMQGKMGLEVRPVIRNALDLTVSLLAQCGDPAGFKARHRAFMLSQSEWLGKARNAPQSQQAIWARGDAPARMNAASALGLTDLLTKQGASAADLNRCLMDDAAAKVLIENGAADKAEFGFPGTPSFALDGKLIPDVYGWEALYPVLNARFAEAKPDAAPPPSTKG